MRVTADVPSETSAIQLGGVVFLDRNGNGVWDSADNGLSGVRVELLPCTTGSVLQVVTTSADTDHPGLYRFDGLSAGTYRLRFTAPDAATPYQITSPLVSPTTGLTACFPLDAADVPSQPDVGFFPGAPAAKAVAAAAEKGRARAFSRAFPAAASPNRHNEWTQKQTGRGTIPSQPISIPAVMDAIGSPFLFNLQVQFRLPFGLWLLTGLPGLCVLAAVSLRGRLIS
eukprot:EG_transcript_14848